MFRRRDIGGVLPRTTLNYFGRKCVVDESHVLDSTYRVISSAPQYLPSKRSDPAGPCYRSNIVTHAIPTGGPVKSQGLIEPRHGGIKYDPASDNSDLWRKARYLHMGL
jgi:hypothetical protein